MLVAFSKEGLKCGALDQRSSCDRTLRYAAIRVFPFMSIEGRWRVANSPHFLLAVADLHLDSLFVVFISTSGSGCCCLLTPVCYLSRFLGFVSLVFVSSVGRRCDAFFVFLTTYHDSGEVPSLLLVLFSFFSVTFLYFMTRFCLV